MNYTLPWQKLVLASESFTRKKMLENAGLEFTVEAAFVDEEALRKAGEAEGVSDIDMATTLAEAKAARVSQRHSEDFVIGVDQILACNGKWYGKSCNLRTATATLKALVGKPHQLITVAVIFQGGQRLWHHCEKPTLAIRNLDDDAIKKYLNLVGDSAFQTPGCYQIEGPGAQILDSINGCPYAVLGLPLLQMLAFLREHGLDCRI